MPHADDRRRPRPPPTGSSSRSRTGSATALKSSTDSSRASGACFFIRIAKYKSVVRQQSRPCSDIESRPVSTKVACRSSIPSKSKWLAAISRGKNVVAGLAVLAGLCIYVGWRLFPEVRTSWLVRPGANFFSPNLMAISQQVATLTNFRLAGSSIRPLAVAMCLGFFQSDGRHRDYAPFLNNAHRGSLVGPNA